MAEARNPGSSDLAMPYSLGARAAASVGGVEAFTLRVAPEPVAEGTSGQGHEGGNNGVTHLRTAGVEPRILAAWREWLSALATDAEAAIAAAHVYGELPPDARDAWLDALAEDAPKLAVPAMAIYAPLLSVEADDGRLERIMTAIAGDPTHGAPSAPGRALRGIAAGGARVVALVTPLYLSFVRVLWCRYQPDEGFAWVRHDPLLGARDAPTDGTLVDDVALETTPLKLVVEELAHAVLAQRRSGTELPSALHLFADLFDAQPEGDPLAE